MRKFLFILLCLGLIVPCFNCSKKEVTKEGVTEIKFWHIWGDKLGRPVIEQIINDYNKTHPKVRVVPLVVPFSEVGPFIQKVITAIAGGTPPDVLTFSGIPVLAGKGALIPLDELIKRDNFDIDSFVPYRVKICRWNGHIYAIKARNY